MISRDLEFRGINRHHLGMYFEELGGKRVEDTDSFPYIFVAEDWEGQVLSEVEISFTSVFKVNAVVIRFIADDVVGLEELIKKYRSKTTRVGG